MSKNNAFPAHEILNESISAPDPVIEKANAIFDYIQEQRRFFHMYPELSMEEENTCKHICEELEKMNIPYKIIQPYGIVGYIEGKGTARKNAEIGLRADMDALKIEELNDIPYKSRNAGKMHACGHDAHMAMLLGAAKLLMENREFLNGNVKLLFQEGEEKGEGAPVMVASGEVDKCKAVFALHQNTLYRAGEIATRQYGITGNNSIFIVTVNGKGGHASAPDLTIDPIAVSAEIITSLQHIVSREVSPAESVVVSIGYIESSTSSRYRNIIPDWVKFSGTIRFNNLDLGEKLEKSFKRIVSNVAGAHGAKADIIYVDRAFSVYNDPILTDFAEKVFASILGNKNVKTAEQSMTSEDFWEYQVKAPVCYSWLGTGNDIYDKPLHSPHYNLDESALPLGSAVFYKLAIDYFNSIS